MVREGRQVRPPPRGLQPPLFEDLAGVALAGPEEAGPQAEGGPGLDVGDAVADHPRPVPVVARVAGQRFPQQPRLRLAAFAAVLRAVEAEVRAEDAAAGA